MQGSIRYRFLGHGLDGDFTAWSAGALAERTTESAGEVLERETLSYVRSSVRDLVVLEALWMIPKWNARRRDGTL